MKNRSEIWLRALDELGARCSVSTSRTAKTMAARVAREGESFLTLTLPAFGKQFETSLRTGRIAEDQFAGFARQPYRIALTGNNGMVIDEVKHGHGIPKFLGEFLALVFDNGIRVPMSQFYPSDGGETPIGADSLGFHLVPHAYGPSRFESGSTEHDRWIDAVHGIRQLCLMFGKEESLCDDSKTQAALRQYEDTDQELDDPFRTN